MRDRALGTLPKNVNHFVVMIYILGIRFGELCPKALGQGSLLGALSFWAELF
jgi:hypothetical protein